MIGKKAPNTLETKCGNSHLNSMSVEFKVNTFPSSDKYHILKVMGSCIYQIICPKAYCVDDNLEWEHFDLIFSDPITADIICELLNEELRGD